MSNTPDEPNTTADEIADILLAHVAKLDEWLAGRGWLHLPRENMLSAEIKSIAGPLVIIRMAVKLGCTTYTDGMWRNEDTVATALLAVVDIITAATDIKTN